jgi:hypothetical protein
LCVQRRDDRKQSAAHSRCDKTVLHVKTLHSEW